jgi:hypothetical protein
MPPKKSISEVINEVKLKTQSSSHGYGDTVYNLIPVFPFNKIGKHVRLGLASFSMDIVFQILEDDERTGAFYYYFKCDKVGQGYCDFFFYCIEEIIKKYDLDILIFNEYSFPSFLYQKGKYSKYNHKIIRDRIDALANKGNIVIFPGTLNVCDKTLKRDFGYAQGYLFQPKEDYVRVKKCTQAEAWDKSRGRMVDTEGFRSSNKYKLSIFRTCLGDFAISICADFINKNHDRHFLHDFVRLEYKPSHYDVNKELSLLIAPSRDESKIVEKRAESISQRTSFFVAYVNSLEYYKGDEMESSNIFLEGEKISCLSKKDFKKAEYRAFLKTYDLNFSEPQRRRFMNKKIISTIEER